MRCAVAIGKTVYVSVAAMGTVNDATGLDAFETEEASYAATKGIFAAKTFSASACGEPSTNATIVGQA